MSDSRLIDPSKVDALLEELAEIRARESTLRTRASGEVAHLHIETPVSTPSMVGAVQRWVQAEMRQAASVPVEINSLHSNNEAQPATSPPEPRPAPERKPDGYAFRYHDCIRFNGGERVNGGYPQGSIPYYFDVPPPAKPDEGPDELAALKKYHAEIVEIDRHECEAMRLTRWAIEEIERLRMAERMNVESVARLQQERDALQKKNAELLRDWLKERSSWSSLCHDQREQLRALRGASQPPTAINLDVFAGMRQYETERAGLPPCGGITGWKAARCTKSLGHAGPCEFRPGASAPPNGETYLDE